MIRQIGSQSREPLNESGYKLFMRVSDTDVILMSEENSQICELWCAEDDHVGYTIEVDGVGYEFIRTLDKAAIRNMLESVLLDME